MVKLAEDVELEPLFEYRRVQPRNVISLDDDDVECIEICVPKKRKISEDAVDKGKTDVKALISVDGKEEEDDWLPPPPKFSGDAKRMISEDSTLKELRLRKQELLSFAHSAKDTLQTVEECAKREDGNSVQSSLDALCIETTKPLPERLKIVISVQDKVGLKQFRVYMDDSFQRIFKMYAKKVKLDLKQLSFSFDGDKINPSQTPGDIGMEDDDIIEVHMKSC